jgi:hypothetical protein
VGKYIGLLTALILALLAQQAEIFTAILGYSFALLHLAGSISLWLKSE